MGMFSSIATEGTCNGVLALIDAELAREDVSEQTKEALLRVREPVERMRSSAEAGYE